MAAAGQAYNAEDSEIYSDAVVLRKLAKKTAAALEVKLTKATEAASSGADPRLKLGKKTAAGTDKLDGHPTKKPQDAVWNCKQLFEWLKRTKDDNGKPLVDFIKPPPKSNTRYHDAVPAVSDIASISKQLNSHGFDSVAAMVHQIYDMIVNTLIGFEYGSAEYRGAERLRGAMLAVCERKLSVQDRLACPLLDVAPALLKVRSEDLLIGMLSAKSTKGNLLAEHFFAVPPEAEDSDEWVVTMVSILNRHYYGKYRQFAELVADVESMFAIARRVAKDTKDPRYIAAVTLEQSFVSAARSAIETFKVNTVVANQLDKKVFRTRVAAELEEKKIARESAAAAAAEESALDDVKMVDTEETTEVTAGKYKYTVGDFVYVKNRVVTAPPMIGTVMKFRKDSTGTMQCILVRYYRPDETFHVPNTTFYEKEVFRSADEVQVAVSELSGKCGVLFMKEFLANTIVGVKAADLYCCESRYSSKAKTFSKIKVFPRLVKEPELAPRPTKLAVRDLIKVKSVFLDERAGIARDDGEEADEDHQSEDPLAGSYSVLHSRTRKGTYKAGCIYYDLMDTANFLLGVGDFVYVSTSGLDPNVMMIEQLYIDLDGISWLKGPVFVPPHTTKHETTRSFFAGEHFLLDAGVGSGQTAEVSDVLRVCDIRHSSSFDSEPRRVDVAPADVLICDSKYTAELSSKFAKISKLPDLPRGAIVPATESYTPDNLTLPQRMDSPFLLPANATESAPSKSKSTRRESEGNSKSRMREDKVKGSSHSKDRGGETDDHHRDGESSDVVVQAPSAKELQQSRQEAHDAMKRMKDLTLTVARLAARAAAVRAGGKASHAEQLNDFERAPLPPVPAQLYINELRDSEQATYPDKTFAQITTMLHERWKNAPRPVHEVWENKANKLNGIMTAAFTAGAAEIKKHM